MDRRTILVTGGAGYIGSHICKALAARGLTPVTYDNLCSGNKSAVKWGPLEKGDIRDQGNLSAVLEKHNPAAIMHFAALIQVGESVENPALYYDNNVRGSYALLEAARNCGIKHMVFSSTAAVYGLPETGLIPEGAPLSPINPYGNTKRAMENMISDYAGGYGLNHAILRYFNAAGADPDGEAGTAYPKDTHLIPLLMQVAAGQREEIGIYGTDYNTPDGTAIRDYIHVTDLADAHIKALEYILEKNENITLNLGTNQGYSVREVIEEARAVTRRQIKAIEMPRRAGDPPVLVADANKARVTLGWSPQKSDLGTILETAWRWKCRQAGVVIEQEVA